MDEKRLLSNVDLEYYFTKMKIPLHKIVYVTQLKEIKPKIGNYIINLDRTETKGTHWCCFIIYKNNKSTPCKLIYYDSFGIENNIPQEVIKFGKRYNPNIKIIFNYDQIQDKQSIYCGWFVLYFINYFNKHKKCNNKMLLLKQHNKQFKINSNLLENDIKLTLLIKDIFT